MSAGGVPCMVIPFSRVPGGMPGSRRLRAAPGGCKERLLSC